MTSNGYTAIIIVAGLGLVAILFNVAPDSAPAQLPLILTALGGFIVLLQKQGDTDKKVDENTVVTNAAKNVAAQSVEASKDNANAIATVTMKQDQTNGMVDGHLSGLTAQIAALTQTVARMETDKATKAAETADIISAITGTPLGSTPAHGTPIGGGAPTEGATVITIDPPEAATITSVPPKGKRPKVGDQQ